MELLPTPTSPQLARAPCRALSTLLLGLAVSAPVTPALATCLPAPTPVGDTISCTGASGALDTLSGNDDVEVTPDAAVDADASESISDAGGSSSVQLYGIVVGPGDDRVTNQGAVTATGTASTDVVAVDPSLVDTTGDVDVEGESDSEVRGIAGEGGEDVLANEGDVTVGSHAEATGTSVELDLVGSASSVDASLEARATGVGLDGGAADDVLTNTGHVDVHATADASRSGGDVTLVGVTGSATDTRAQASSTGIQGGLGQDTITNAGTLRSDATAHAHTDDTGIGLAGLASGSSVAESTATAVGLAGDEGADDLANTGLVEVRADAKSSTTDVGLQVTGGIGTLRAATRPTASATGLAGGTGEDRIENGADVDVEATATARRVRAAVSMAGEAGSAEDAGLRAESTALGMDGGAGDDSLTNTDRVKARARSEATSVDTTVAVLDFLQETIAVPVEAMAQALGMGGGAGDDSIESSGVIEATAEAVAAFTDVEVNVVDGSGAAADAHAESDATGIGGGAGDDGITHGGTLTSSATAEADVTQVNVSLLDLSIVPDLAGAAADASVTASSEAVGIRGGGGADAIHNTGGGTITVTSTATTHMTSVAASAEGIPAGVEGFVIDEPLVDASAEHLASATGIEGGRGDDTLTNDGSVTATSTSTSRATTVSASIPLLDALGVDVDVFSPGLAVATAGSDARASASGLEGGAGADTILNTGSVDADATADALAVSVSAALELAAPTNPGDANLGSIAGTLAEAGGGAGAIASGIRGGGGADTITQTATGSITGTARADAQSTGVSVAVSGTSQGIFAAGASFADAETAGAATIVGIAGGVGDDAILNEGSIEVDADTNVGATNVVVAGQIAIHATPVAIGLTWTDADTTASATSTGLSGGAGDDAIASTGSVVSKADAEVDAAGISMDVAVGAEGVAVSGAVSQALSHASAAATGISGDQGSDTVDVSGPVTAEARANARSAAIGISVQGELAGVSAGAAVTDSGTSAVSDATGIAGGEGDDTLVHQASGDLLARSEADAASDAVSVDVGVTGVGLSAGAALSWTDTGATATATGMAGGSGSDHVENRGAVEADADAIADGSSVGVALEVAVQGAALGATLTDATTHATATSGALAGGAGDDRIDNQGTLRSSADADATAASISTNVGIAFVPGGAAIADASATATATANGIEAGAGDDVVTQTGSIEAMAKADARGVPVSVTALGASLGDAHVTARATATGIHGGDGDDRVRNAVDGVVTSSAESHAVGTNVGFAVAGAALGDTNVTSTSIANGIDGGLGNDLLLHEGTLASTSTASVGGTNVNLTLAGASIGDASSSARAEARGLAGGEGDDTIASRGDVTVTATADAPSANYNVTGLGAAIGRTDVEASALAVGLDGGDGNDVIDSTSLVTSTATASTGSGNVSATLVGESEVDATVDAVAEAVGIRGGLGDDFTMSAGDVSASADASAASNAKSLNLIGAALGDANTTAEATATGLADGAGDDTLVNDAEIVVSADASARARDMDATVAGGAIAEARVEAIATAVGMHGGADADLVLNRSRAQANASASVDASSTSVSITGFAGSDDTLVARSDATALHGGDGDDHVRNEGTAIADARASATLSGSSIGIFGVTSTAGTASTEPGATGLAGGEGDDVVENTGSVDVDAGVSMNLGSSAFQFGGVGSTSGAIDAAARATGMAGDGGDDLLLNAGDVDVDAAASLTTDEDTTVIFGVSRTEGEVASADPLAVGMDGGDGDDTLESRGSLHVVADSSVESNKSSYTFGGGSNADSVVAARGTALGMAGGAGSDFLRNAGVVSVEARADLAATGGTLSTFGNSNASASTEAVSAAAGIDGGADADTIVNAGSIDVTARSDSLADNTSDTGFLFGQGASESDAGSSRRASGIDAGAGGGLIQNQGEVAARTTGSSDAETDSDGADFIDGDASAHSAAGSDGVATGIRGGDGALRIENFAGARITATATHEAFADAFADADGLDGDGSATALATADGEARGIWLGEGNHEVINEGDIVALADPRGDAVAEADADEQGRATVTATVNVDAEAEGIRTGDGDNLVVNRGTLTATARPRALEAEGLSNRDSFAVGNVDATVTVRADADAVARGIHTGSGDDRIANEGEILVTADAQARAVANADGDGANGDGTASPTADANADALGIDAGSGNDRIENRGTLTVLAQTYALADADADADTGIVGNSSEAKALPTVVSDADATGIRAESGDNLVVNHGVIVVTADQTTNTADGDTFGGGDGSFQIDGTATAEATGRARARGISTGDGADRIENRGSLTVTATPWARAEAHARGTGLDGDAFATAIALSNDALAVGIDAGDGDNVVINTGTIEVAALPAASAVPIASPGAPDSDIDPGEWGEDATQHARRALAVGISTGSGNDTIVNLGEILTSATGTDSATVAIRSGDGADTVVLGDGSLAVGTIALEAGDDTLELLGTPRVIGAIDAGPGADGLLLYGSGAFGSPLGGFETARKIGAGAYTLAGLPGLQRLELDQGALALESDYAMPAGSLLQSRIDGDGSSGSLSSTGEIQLGGDLEVTKGPHAFADAAHDVVRGSSVSGVFEVTRLPDATPLLSFRLARQTDAVQVIADAESFTTVAGSRFERKMGEYLDAILPIVEGDASRVLGALQDLPGESLAVQAAVQRAVGSGLVPTAAHGEALATLGPTGYDDLTLSAVNVSLSGAQRVQERLWTRRNELRAARLEMGRGVSAAGTTGADGSGWRGCADGDAEPLRARACAVWLTGWGQGGRVDADEGFGDFDQRTGGFNAGVDYAFGDRVVAGLAFGHAGSDVDDGSGRRYRGEIESTWGSLYGTWYGPRSYLEGVVSYGSHLFDNQRSVAVGGMQREASGSHRGRMVSALLGGGYRTKLGAWQAGPYGWVHYAHLDEESFTESGAGGVSLRMGSRDSDSLSSLLGVRLSRPSDDGLFVPELEAGWRRSFRLDDRELGGAFAGTSGPGFAIDGRDTEGSSARVSGALHWIDRERLSLTTRLGGELGPGYQELFGALQLSGRF